MGLAARLAALTLAAALLGACGDPVVVLGDWPGILRTVAGIPDSTGLGLDELATRTPLNGPEGLASGDDGTLFIADQRGARILAVSSSGRVQALVEHFGCMTEPCLRRPGAIALDGRGALLIVDVLARRIWRLDLQTRALSPFVGNGQSGSAADGTRALDAPVGTLAGIALGADGRVYFSERSGHRVRTVEPDGTLGTIAGTGAVGFSGEGGPAREARLTAPAGLAVATGFLYIADSGNNMVRRVELGTGNIHRVAGTGAADFGGDGGPATEAQLKNPIAVAVSTDGNTLFIADIGNHRVRRVQLPTGVITTFAGTGEIAYNGDGRAAGETTLNGPAGLTVSRLDFLYIADTGHHIVRRTAIRF